MEIDVTQVVQDRQQFMRWDDEYVRQYVQQRPLFKNSRKLLEMVREFCAESELFDVDAAWEADYQETQVNLVEVVMCDIRQLVKTNQLTEQTVIVAESAEFITQVDQPGHTQFGRWLVQLFE